MAKENKNRDSNMINRIAEWIVCMIAGFISAIIANALLFKTLFTDAGAAHTPIALIILMSITIGTYFHYRMEYDKNTSEKDESDSNERE